MPGRRKVGVEKGDTGRPTKIADIVAGYEKSKGESVDKSGGDGDGECERRMGEDEGCGSKTGSRGAESYEPGGCKK